MSSCEVKDLRSTVQWLHDLASACKTLSNRSKSFGGFQVHHLFICMIMLLEALH